MFATKATVSLPTLSQILVTIGLGVCLVVGWIAARLFRWDPLGTNSRKPIDGPKKVVYAFFHPHASGGGGGERVLWKMIQFLQSSSHQRLRCGKGEETTIDGQDEIEIIIYTIDPPSTKERDLRLDAERRFDVKIPNPVQLVSLEEYKHYLAPQPFLSLVMESWGTMKLARQALLATILQQTSSHDSEFVFCDTTGCAFTFAVVRWMCPPTIRILAYVHYPTISTDMMLWEWQTKKSSIPQKLKTLLKLGYYYGFSIAYGLCGSMADLVMVNSTWTYNHIHSLWRFRSRLQAKQQPIQIVYPPCRVPSNADDAPATNNNLRTNTILSIGQFRPEKNHKLQIEALSILFKNHPEHRTNESDRVQLLLIGSCRNDADRGRVQELKDLVQARKLQDHVVFNINPPYKELQEAAFRASIGIHTMRQEHFGIGIVEMMASGLLTIAHDSGGPKSDIVAAETGFLATSAKQYASAMHTALTLDREAATTMRQKASASSTRFSDEAFDKSLERVLPLLYY